MLLAIASAAMLPQDRAGSLSGDLEKIEVMTARAADALTDENKTDSAHGNEYICRMGISGDGKTALRCDEMKKCSDVDIISQSKRKDGVYTAVPRIV